jgi:replicative DNA helicase
VQADIIPHPATLRDMPVVPPHSIEAEQAVLGSALNNEAVLDWITWLRPEDFFEPVHGRIYAAVLQERAAGRRPAPGTIMHLFATDASLRDLDGPRYIKALSVQARNIIDAKGHAVVVRRLAKKRALAALCRTLAARAEDSSDPAETAELFGECRREFDDLCHDETTPLGRDIQEVVDEISGRLANPPPMFSTGLPLLDKSLGGGLPLGYVVAFKARPKNFKTGTLHTLALALAQQKIPTFYFAFEMGAARLVERMLGHIGGFNSAMFKHKDNDLQRRVNFSRQALPDMRLMDCPGMSFDRLRAVANEAVLRLGTKLFVLDYWQLVKDPKRTANRSEFLDEVAQWTADFAKEHRVTWLIASQENREGQTRGSDGLVMACDWIAALHKHEKPFFLGAMGEVETLWMDVEYSRDGPGGPIGGAEEPLLFIDPRGPHLAEIPQ